MEQNDKFMEIKYEEVVVDENAQDIVVPQPYGFGVRHIQVLLIFSSLSISFFARAHLSVTIVAMTDIPKIDNTNNITTILENDSNESNHSNLELFNNSHKDIDNQTNVNVIEDVRKDVHKFTGFNNDNDTLILLNVNNTLDEDSLSALNVEKSVWDPYRTYSWPKDIQEMVLGSFFLGYMIMMTPMGFVCQRWGGMLPLQIGLSASGVLNLLTPWLAAWGGWKAVCASRVAMGLCQAGTFPGIHTLIAKWVPLSERARLSTYIYVGCMVGSMLAFQMSGFVAASPLGWPSMFWLTGGLCITMAVLLTIFGAPSPHQHNTITDQERNYILGYVHMGVEKRLKTPWKAILTSTPAWAVFITHVGINTTFLFLFSQIPTYLHYILNVDIETNGVFTSLPYLANIVMSIMYGQLSDHCVNNKTISVKNARMISNTCANVFPAICLALLSFTSSTAVGVTLLVIALGTHGSAHTGYLLNYIDLSPNFSGPLMATGNTLLNIAVLILPVIISNIVTDVRDPSQWRLVMFGVAGFSLVCNFVYVVFMSTDLQKWNDSHYRHTVHNEEIAEKENDEKENAVKLLS